MLTIIKLEPEANGFHQMQSQSGRTECWMGGWVAVPEDLIADISACRGYCNLTIENDVLTGITPNTELYESTVLEEERSSKLRDLSDMCNSIITGGCDVALSDGTIGHISLSDEDQINLTNAAASVQAGAEGYPYHLDGELCKVYSAADILLMATAATQHKLYHTTYFNHLKAWVNRVATLSELESITYGTELPEDLAKNMEAVLEATS